MKESISYIILLKQGTYWFNQVLEYNCFKYKIIKYDYIMSCDIFLEHKRNCKINSNVFFLIVNNNKILNKGIIGCIDFIDSDQKILNIRIIDRDSSIEIIDLDFLEVCKSFYQNGEYLINYQLWDNDKSFNKEELNPNIKKKIIKINRKLLTIRSDALHQYRNILKQIGKDPQKNYVDSLHGFISNLKSKTLNLNGIKYESFDEIFNAYYTFFLNNLEKSKKNEKTEIIIRNELLMKYIKLYLERDFYRHIFPITREKVEEDLSEIYFGSNYSKAKNKNMKALFIKTRNKGLNVNKKWESHYAHIKNAKYIYYSIGHLLKEGIILNNERRYFNSIKEFYQLDGLIETRDEYRFLNCYLDYISKFDNLEKIPLLIPQFRFDKDKIKHKYRLDFLIMNYNMYPAQKIGIELSRKQTHINDYDRKKRNSFFEKYGITILEFTDDDLKDISKLFKEKIVRFL